MAHGDYDCCAICDGKQSYSVDPYTKGEICSSCVAHMARHGVIVGSVDELIQWIRDTPVNEVRELLKTVSFRFCYYGNDVDEAVLSIGLKCGEDRAIL